MAARPRGKTRRSSCDACGDAKVKCDRGQPGCGRCLFMDQTCTYSMCRRMGKPPKRQNAQTEATCTEASLEYESNRASHTDSTSSSTAHSPAPPTTIMEDTLDPRVLLTHADAQQRWRAFVYNSSDMIATTGIGSAQAYDNGLPPTPSPSDVSTNNHFDVGGTLTAFTTNPEDLNIGDAWAHYDPSMDALFAPTKNRVHDCEREARTILSDLDVIEKSYTSPLLQQSDADTPLFNDKNQLPLDETLQIARRAVHTLSQLLACPCARLPGLALVHASVIWRVLQVYRQAAIYALRITTDPHGPSPSFIASSMASTTTWPVIPPFGVRQFGETSATPAASLPGLSIGSFNVNDDAVRLVLSIQILSSEVRQVGKLIDMFALGGANARPQALGGGFSSDPEGYLRFWLRKEHDQTSDIIRGGLLAAST